MYMLGLKIEKQKNRSQRILTFEIQPQCKIRKRS